MSKSSRPRKTALQKPAPAGLPAGEATAPLQPLEPPARLAESPTTLSDADDLKPRLDVLAPPEGYDIPGAAEVNLPNLAVWLPEGHEYQGSTERASVPVSVEARRSSDPLSWIGWYVNDDNVPPQVRVDVPDPGEYWTGTKNVEVPYIPGEGDQVIKVWVAVPSPGNRVVYRTRPVKYLDVTPPTFEIVSPKNGATVPLGVPLKVQGWAEDRQSGVAAVEWSLDGGPWQVATITPGRRVDWQFEVANLSAVHMIAVRFRDQKGNTTPRDAASVITITAAGAFKPRNANDLVSLRAYLEDLGDYAKKHVNTASASPKQQLSEKDLTDLFVQPFEQLMDGRVTFGNQPLNQLRAAVEVLRKHVAQPVAHWKFDERQGTTAADASGNGNAGTLQGGAAWAAGRFGGALSFAGVDDYVQVNHSPTLEVGKNGADFSVAFQLLLRQGATGQWRAIMHKGAVDQDRTFAMWLQRQDNRILYAISTTASYNEYGTSKAQIALNAWTAIAYVKAGNQLQLYINGVLDSELKLAGASISNAGPLYLGKDNDPRFTAMNGCLDDVRIYSYALSADQIAALDTGQPQLVAHRRFDEVSATTALLATGTQELQAADVSISSATDIPAPNIQITNPPDGSEVPGASERATVAVTARAWTTQPANMDARIKGMIWYRDGSEVASIGPIRPPVTDVTETKSIEIPYLASEPWQTIRVLAGTRTDVEADTKSRVVYRDKTAPTFEVVWPKNNEKIPPEGSVVVRGWAEDRQSRVAKVEWRLDGGAFQTTAVTPDPDNSYRMNWSFGIPNLAPGPHTLAMRFSDNKGNVTRDDAAVITVIKEDIPAPGVTITAPPNGTEIGGTSETATVEVSIQARSSQPNKPLALIKSIEWYLDDRKIADDPIDPPTSAVDKMRAISVPYTVQKEQRKITVFARTVSDVRGEQTISVLYPDKTAPKFDVVSPKNDAKVFVGQPLLVQGHAEDRQSGVVGVQWSVDGGEWQSVRSADIVPDPQDNYRKNWQFIIYPTFGSHTLNLRCLDKKGNVTPVGAAVLKFVATAAVTEADYRLAAYQALLNRIGTSYEEIRLARGADDDARKALASRLGITLDPGTDQLEQLYLPSDKITEARLEELFGLADTTRDPPTDVREPLLLGWRRGHLEVLWRDQDKAEYSKPEAPTPIIDPDLIGQDDLQLAEAGNPAFDLWQARAIWLANTFAALQNTKRSDAMLAFETVVSETLGQPVAKLLELDRQQKAGIDITVALNGLHLTQPAFKRLLRVHDLIVNTSVDEREWDDVFHILTQARKLQEYPTWRTEETPQDTPQKQIALTPKLFRISETVPQLPPWRGTWRARLNWLDTLQARIDQLQTTEDALRAAVSAVEEQTLPVLRDALVADLAGRLGQKTDDVAERLVQRLLVDLKTNASQRTTRLIQAIETVQGVLFALRAGQLANDHPAASWTLTVTEGHFDEEWQWMGNYATWRAAMFVFFFPESVLLPSLREPYDAAQFLDPLHRTLQFEALLKELRKRPRLTPDQARSEASDYLDNLLKDDRLKDTGPSPMPKKLRDAINATRPSPSEAPTFLTDDHTDETLGNLRQLCRDIVAPYGNQIPNYIQEIFYGVPLQLAWQLQKSGAYLAALDWFQTVYAYNLPPDKRKIYYGLERETNVAPILSRSDHWLTEGLNPHVLAARRTGSNPHTRYTLMSLARCLMDFADSEFTRDTAESLARARALYLTAQRLLLSPDFATPTVIPEGATLLPNPLLELLRLRADVQLTKMREGRNIAGMKRQVELPVSLPPGPSDMPTIGAGGQLIIPGARPVLRPTPYYFRVLLERSKQLVNIAQQIEAAYLAALEKRDAENYNLLKANNDLQLAFEGVELQNRRVNEAQAGVGVARAQMQRARVMSERYSMLKGLGLSTYEQQMLGSYQEAISFIRQAGGASAEAARLGGTAASLNAAAQAASTFINMHGFSVPNFAAAALYTAAGAASFASAQAQAQAAIYSANAQVASTQAQIYGIQASAEWRQREFETQAIIAEQDVAIGEAQIGAAQAHVGVADQERKIAQTQVTQAQAVAEFLARKFTNAELYEWMSGVLGEVYSYFLQQATALAQLAENQLAFERQDTPPKFIQVDYWDVPSDTGLLTTDQKAPDRKGLTGSARLLRDLYQLDQYAFETDKRKLNLSQTFSLARMAPYEFELFRQSGVLAFATPMALFDRDFPGHYLRLIKRVRVSVIALIPPSQGIRATLSASGVSRAVTGGDIYQTVVVRRDPELVALTSPISATGVFEMDVQSEMLLPFESMGVDTDWAFEMPRAANPFDFRTVADVLLTIEYTALNSRDYRQQVIKTLPQTAGGERSFIFSQQFADAWYDLHNPGQSAAPMRAKFRTWREDFPPNIADLAIERVTLFFSRASSEPTTEPLKIEVQNLQLTFLDQQRQQVTVDGGPAATFDGVFSSHGNATGWGQLIGKPPVGEWELALPDRDDTRAWFANEQILDIVLVITYRGRTPAWPS